MRAASTIAMKTDSATRDLKQKVSGKEKQTGEYQTTKALSETCASYFAFDFTASGNQASTRY